MKRVLILTILISTNCWSNETKQAVNHTLKAVSKQEKIKEIKKELEDKFKNYIPEDTTQYALAWVYFGTNQRITTKYFRGLRKSVGKDAYVRPSLEIDLKDKNQAISAIYTISF